MRRCSIVAFHEAQDVSFTILGVWLGNTRAKRVILCFDKTTQDDTHFEVRENHATRFVLLDLHPRQEAHYVLFGEPFEERSTFKLGRSLCCQAHMPVTILEEVVEEWAFYFLPSILKVL